MLVRRQHRVPLGQRINRVLLENSFLSCSARPCYRRTGYVIKVAPLHTCMYVCTYSGRARNPSEEHSSQGPPADMGFQLGGAKLLQCLIVPTWGSPCQLRVQSFKAAAILCLVFSDNPAGIPRPSPDTYFPPLRLDPHTTPEHILCPLPAIILCLSAPAPGNYP
jgi:hypothetical protein